MKSILQQIKINIPLVVMGDFNVKCKCDTNTSSFVQMMQETYRCTQHITDNTTVNNTLIDLVFSNNVHVQCGTLSCYWSDHKAMYCVLHDKSNN